MRTHTFAIALALAAVSFVPHAARALDQIIVVSGEASIAVAPDIATVSAGVTTQARTAREATSVNNGHMQAVLDALKQASIANRDVQTSRLSIQPTYEPNRGQGTTITGFQATNQVTVKLRD